MAEENGSQKPDSDFVRHITMKTDIIKIEEVSKFIIPPGQYQGIWGGYIVTIGDKWRLTTKDGVRGINIPCTVTVAEDGSASVVANSTSSATRRPEQ